MPRQQPIRTLLFLASKSFTKQCFSESDTWERERPRPHCFRNKTSHVNSFAHFAPMRTWTSAFPALRLTAPGTDNVIEYAAGKHISPILVSVPSGDDNESLPLCSSIPFASVYFR